jgi:hypothetical protein
MALPAQEIAAGLVGDPHGIAIEAQSRWASADWISSDELSVGVIELRDRVRSGVVTQIGSSVEYDPSRCRFDREVPVTAPLRARRVTLFPP